MLYTVHLFDAEGESLGFCEFAASDWKVDDIFDAGGGRRYRIKTICRRR